MQLRTNRNRQDRVEGADRTWRRRKPIGRVGMAGVVALATLATAYKISSAQYIQQPAGGTNPTKSIILPEANRPPDANAQMAMRDQQARKGNIDAVNAERKRQMMQAAEMLETMAIALKAEVDNTSSDALSQNAVHKAETIEKLARLVKDRMTVTVGPN